MYLAAQHCTFSSSLVCLWGHLTAEAYSSVFVVVVLLLWFIFVVVNYNNKTKQNDRDLLRATAITRGWNGYRSNSLHRKLTLEKKSGALTTELSPLPFWQGQVSELTVPRWASPRPFLTDWKWEWRCPWHSTSFHCYFLYTHFFFSTIGTENNFSLSFHNI